jgi:hypothetical protein
MSNDNWVLGIEDEMRNAPYYKILWGIICLLSGFVVFVLNKIPNIPWEIPETIFLISFFVFFIALIKLIESPKNPEYLAYYLYKIGEKFSDFENENRYLKKNKQYIKNCNTQISYLSNEKFRQSYYFIGDIIKFFDDLEDLIMRLNHLYTIGNEDKTIMTRIMGMSSDNFIEEKEFISSNLMELANLIYREHSILIPEHMNIASIILKELDYIPKRQFKKSSSKYLKEIWNKLHYNLKYLIFGITIFVIIFVISSQFLEHFGQEQTYSTAMIASAALTAVALAQIDRFITR